MNTKNIDRFSRLYEGFDWCSDAVIDRVIADLQRQAPQPTRLQERIAEGLAAHGCCEDEGDYRGTVERPDRFEME